MITLSRIKGRRPQPRPAMPENNLATESCASGSLQPAAAPRKVPLSLSTVAEGPNPSHEEIAALAYRLWEVNGRRAGADRENWLWAEALLRTQA